MVIKAIHLKRFVRSYGMDLRCLLKADESYQRQNRHRAYGNRATQSI